MKTKTFIVGIGILTMLVAATAVASDSLNNAEVGHKLYSAKCGSCHQTPDPTLYDDEKWDYWINRMAKKSKVSEEQFTVLNHYIEALRTGKK